MMSYFLHFRALPVVFVVTLSSVVLPVLCRVSNVDKMADIVEYPLDYIGNLSDANAFEHTHLLAALGGLTNGRASWPVL